MRTWDIFHATIVFAFPTIVFAFPLLLVGCIDYYPSASTPFGALPNDGNFHVKRVVTELQCEINDFVSTHPIALDPKSTAIASIIYQTDVTGYVSYVGVDLSKIGLIPLAELVSISNKVPNLSAKASSKGTNIWQIDFVMAQKKSTILDCASTTERYPPILRFDIDRWLEKFFRRINDDRFVYLGEDESIFPTQVSNINGTCLKTITVKLAFQLIADISGGASSGIVGALPISALNFDYNPAFTHTLNLAITARQDKGTLCVPQPAQVDYGPLLVEIKKIVDGKPQPPGELKPQGKNLDEQIQKPSGYSPPTHFLLPAPPSGTQSQPAYIPPNSN
jgi:hypothetical protein